ncbi:MAG: ATP-binding protein, partial [Pyrinomonadaceae bacterium]|nr:ATP-binding protein [Pyrinomonadaceae bacterium]
VSRDYIRARHRLEIETVPRALVYSDLLAESLKRAPQIMARYYRRSAAIGVRDLIANFKLQSVPSVLFDYSRFKQSYKGANESEVAAQIQAENSDIALPQIVYSANCVEFYPLIQGIIDDERCAVALGFDSGYFTDDNQTVWIVAEIESKLEATNELTEFWLDRLEAVAVFCNFNNYKIWLIAPEGFTSDAVGLLKERGALGSSFAQIEILAKQVKAVNVIKQTPRENPNEYEIVVPMGDDTELIAAQAVEEIARRYDFKPAAINQIKTALIEACINATEHSLSPDQKIYQKFVIENGKLVITISNRGVQMPPHHKNGASESANPSGRRGWGLKLIRNLMDEVEFEQVDDGTRIRMTKYLHKTS